MLRYITWQVIISSIVWKLISFSLLKCCNNSALSHVHINWTIISLLSSTDHSEEDAKLWVHIHVVSIGEDKVFTTFLLAGENDGNLLGRHRQNREVDAVEFIETAPRTGLSQTWKQTQICKKTLQLSRNIKYALACLCSINFSCETALLFFLALLCLQLQCSGLSARTFKRAFFSTSSF